ncbi:Hpt domain-containing protein [Puniceibacterium confluentis]|uniref:Hpt domain-containing protein n=1 Tax=Puniceibacterium confluentis TaxID=1958944 RepID=UPI0011B62C6B|nr:Hpt domain-containing protein [Puniceibacterium confluentis]
MIDWQRIHELHSEIGADDFQEVVDLFLSEVEDSLGDLASVTINAQLLQERLHFLKGSALNLGFSEMARLCQAGELAAAAGQHQTVKVAKVHEVFAESRTAFLRDLAAQLTVS